MYLIASFASDTVTVSWLNTGKIESIMALNRAPRLSLRGRPFCPSALPAKHFSSYFPSSHHSLTHISRRLFSSAASLDQSQVAERVVNVVKNFHKIDGSVSVNAESHFTNDLGLDSLDTVEVVMAFEDEFAIEIPDVEAEKIQSCKDAIKYISSHPHAK